MLYGLGMKWILSFLVLAEMAAASPVIDDRELASRFEKRLGEYADEKDVVSGKVLAGQFEKAGGKELPDEVMKEIQKVKTDGFQYGDESDGVLMMGSAYKCDKCDKWHVGGKASAWALTKDIVVTNYHVMDDAKDAAYGVMNAKGKFAKVVEILGGSREADIVVLRVKGDELRALPVAGSSQVGEKVHVVSHPNGRYYTYTHGVVSRFHKMKRAKKVAAAEWMAITADYAQGSSGAPVFNDKGEVIGMVSSTNSLVYKGGKHRDDKPVQMVVKTCVSLRELLKVVK